MLLDNSLYVTFEQPLVIKLVLVERVSKFYNVTFELVHKLVHQLITNHTELLHCSRKLSSLILYLLNL